MQGDLVSSLPKIRGKYRQNADMSKVTWFRVGGKAEILFRPEDEADLMYFLKHKPKDIPVTILGACSNILVRDGGIAGVVIRLGKNFAKIDHANGQIRIGAGCLNSLLTHYCITYGISGLEFLSGIPGAIGGACAMNAGAYGCEVSDVFVCAKAIDLEGEIHILTSQEMGFTYRGNAVPSQWIFTEVTFEIKDDPPKKVAARVEEIAQARKDSQPVRARTGGSTFRNPPHYKAWQLIDKAGGRGLVKGDAQISSKHCNFLINNGNAKAAELEALGQWAQDAVKAQFGIMLEWEIKRIGSH